MSIPLVQNNEKDSINTSIIAIKRNIERINMLLGLVDSGSPDLSGLATKQELEDAITQVETDLAPVDEVTVDNMQSVTSNAVATSNAMPVNSVTSGNMHSVTSNAVAETVNGLYNLPTGDLPLDANVTMSVAHILFQSGWTNPSFLSHYPSITDFNSAGGGCAYTLVTISANDTTARVSQFCTINYYNTSGAWVYKIYTRRKVDVTWFGWQAIL